MQSSFAVQVNDGIMLASFSNALGEATSIAVQPSGSLVAVGGACDGEGYMCVSRLNDARAVRSHCPLSPLSFSDGKPLAEVTALAFLPSDAIASQLDGRGSRGGGDPSGSLKLRRIILVGDAASHIVMYDVHDSGKPPAPLLAVRHPGPRTSWLAATRSNVSKKHLIDDAKAATPMGMLIAKAAASDAKQAALGTVGAVDANVHTENVKGEIHRRASAEAALRRSPSLSPPSPTKSRSSVESPFRRSPSLSPPKFRDSPVPIWEATYTANSSEREPRMSRVSSVGSIDGNGAIESKDVRRRRISRYSTPRDHFYSHLEDGGITEENPPSGSVVASSAAMPLRRADSSARTDAPVSPTVSQASSRAPPMSSPFASTAPLSAFIPPDAVGVSSIIIDASATPVDRAGRVLSHAGGGRGVHDGGGLLALWTMDDVGGIASWLFDFGALQGKAKGGVAPLVAHGVKTAMLKRWRAAKEDVQKAGGGVTAASLVALDATSSPHNPHGRSPFALLTACEDGTVSAWDALSSACLGLITEHGAQPTAHSVGGAPAEDSSWSPVGWTLFDDGMSVLGASGASDGGGGGGEKMSGLAELEDDLREYEPPEALPLLDVIECSIERGAKDKHEEKERLMHASDSEHHSEKVKARHVLWSYLDGSAASRREVRRQSMTSRRSSLSQSPVDGSPASSPQSVDNSQHDGFESGQDGTQRRQVETGREIGHAIAASGLRGGAAEPETASSAEKSARRSKGTAAGPAKHGESLRGGADDKAARLPRSESTPNTAANVPAKDEKEANQSRALFRSKLRQARSQAAMRWDATLAASGAPWLCPPPSFSPPFALYHSVPLPCSHALALHPAWQVQSIV